MRRVRINWLPLCVTGWMFAAGLVAVQTHYVEALRLTPSLTTSPASALHGNGNQVHTPASQNSPTPTTPSAAAPSQSAPVVTGPPLDYVQPLDVIFRDGKLSLQPQASAYAPTSTHQNSDPFTMLHTSTKGWIVAGIAWYWWVAAVCVTIVVIRLWRARRRTPAPSVPRKILVTTEA